MPHIRDLDAEAKKHEHPETMILLPKDFYGRKGVAAKPAKEVSREWLRYFDTIYLNGQSLAVVAEKERKKLLTKLLKDFLKHTETQRNKKRSDVIQLCLDAMFTNGSHILPANDKDSLRLAGAILKKLRETDYANAVVIDDKKFEAYTLDRYLMAHDIQSKIETENFALTLQTLNSIFKRAYICLTAVETDQNLFDQFSIILRESLLRGINPESHKKALIDFILERCYAGGYFFSLYSALESNLNDGCTFDRRTDVKETTIEFTTTAEGKIQIKEKTPITAITTPGEIIISRVHEDLRSQADEVKQDEKNDDKIHLFLNVLETELQHTLTVNNSPVVVANPDFAHVRSYHPEAQVLVTVKWAKQLEEMMEYSRSYLTNRQHNEEQLNILMRKYPFLMNEAGARNQLRPLRFIQHSHAVDYKGSQLFSYLGRNLSDVAEVVNPTLESLHTHVMDEESFVFAVKLFRRLGWTAKIADKIRPFAVEAGIANPELLSIHILTNEQNVRKIYPFMKPHQLFVVYRLLPEMKFTRATVIIQDPPMLVQFDSDGIKTVIFNQDELLAVLESLNFNQYRSAELNHGEEARSILQDFTPHLLQSIKNSIVSGRLDKELTDQDIIILSKTPKFVAGPRSGENPYKNIFALIQQPTKFVYFDETGMEKLILNDRGIAQLNYNYLLTKPVWLGTINSMLTNIPLPLLAHLDKAIVENEGVAILSGQAFNHLHMPQVTKKDPEFVEIGRPVPVIPKSQLSEEKGHQNKPNEQFRMGTR
jgi:hypothetical protein